MGQKLVAVRMTCRDNTDTDKNTNTIANVNTNTITIANTNTVKMNG